MFQSCVEACPFLFCGPLAMPDLRGRPAARRPRGSCSVELNTWTSLMSRRAEHQWGANWNFSYLRWNYWFRASLNASRTLRCPRQVDGEPEQLSRRKLLEGALQITRALKGDLALVHVADWQPIVERPSFSAWETASNFQASNVEIGSHFPNPQMRDMQKFNYQGNMSPVDKKANLTYARAAISLRSAVYVSPPPQ